MTSRGPGRALHFAVTGALLGSGLGAGCRTTPDTHYTNTGPMNPPQPDDGAAPDHVNEGPVEEPPTEATPTNTGPQPDPAEPSSAPSTMIVNPAPQPPPKLDPGTNNVRKVEEPPPTPKK